MIGFLLGFGRKQPPQSDAERNDLMSPVLFAAPSDSVIVATPYREKGDLRQLSLLGPVLDELYQSNVEWNRYDRKSILGIILGPLNQFLTGRSVFGKEKNESFLVKILDDVCKRGYNVDNGTAKLARIVQDLYEPIAQQWDKPAARQGVALGVQSYATQRPVHRDFVLATVGPDYQGLVDRIGEFQNRFYILEFVLYRARRDAARRLDAGFRASVVNKAAEFFQAQFPKDNPTDIKTVTAAFFIAHIDVPLLMLNTAYTVNTIAGDEAHPQIFGCNIKNSEAIANMILLFASQRAGDFSSITTDPMSGTTGVWNVDDPRVVIEDSVFDRLTQQLTWPLVRQIADINEAGWYSVKFDFYPVGFPANSAIRYTAGTDKNNRSVSIQRALRPLIFGIWRRFYSSYPSGEKIRQMINQISQAREQVLTATQDTIKMFFPPVIFPSFIAQRIYDEITNASIPNSPLDTNPESSGPSEDIIIVVQEEGEEEEKKKKTEPKTEPRRKKKKKKSQPAPPSKEPEAKEEGGEEEEGEKKESVEPSGENFSFLFFDDKSSAASTIIKGDDPRDFIFRALQPLYNEKPVLSPEALAVGLRFVLGVGISPAVDAYISAVLSNDLRALLDRVIDKGSVKKGLDVNYGVEPAYPTIADAAKLKIAFSSVNDTEITLSFGTKTSKLNVTKAIGRIAKSNDVDASFHLFYILVCIFSQVASVEAGPDETKTMKINAIMRNATKTYDWKPAFDHLVPELQFDFSRVVLVLRAAIVSACVRAASIGANERFVALFLLPTYQAKFSRAVTELSKAALPPPPPPLLKPSASLPVAVVPYGRTTGAPDLVEAIQKLVPDRAVVGTSEDSLAPGQRAIVVVFPATLRSPTGDDVKNFVAKVNESTSLKPLLLVGAFDGYSKFEEWEGFGSAEAKASVDGIIRFTFSRTATFTGWRDGVPSAEQILGS